MCIGNIVSEIPIKDNWLFNITNDINKIDKNIPTLIIGWDFSKRIFKNKKLSILNKKIDDSIFWTFSKKEKRVDYEKDFDFFVKNSFFLTKKRIKYHYFNVLTSNLKKTKKILKILNSDKVCYIYILKNSFIYIYVNDMIIGVDFNSIDFLKIDRKRIYKHLYKNGNKVIFNDDFIPMEIKENISDNQKIIPYLFAIKNGK